MKFFPLAAKVKSTMQFTDEKQLKDLHRKPGGKMYFPS